MGEGAGKGLKGEIEAIREQIRMLTERLDSLALAAEQVAVKIFFKLARMNINFIYSLCFVICCGIHKTAFEFTALN